MANLEVQSRQWWMLFTQNPGSAFDSHSDNSLLRRSCDSMTLPLNRLQKLVRLLLAIVLKTPFPRGPHGSYLLLMLAVCGLPGALGV